MADTYADAAHAILDEWIAYARKIAGNGAELHVGVADGGAQHRFPQRLFAAVKACNGAMLPQGGNNGGTSEAGDVEAVRGVRADDGARPHAVRKTRTGSALRTAKGS